MSVLHHSSKDKDFIYSNLDARSKISGKYIFDQRRIKPIAN